MKIDSIKLEYAKKGTLKSFSYNGIKHVKTLPYLSVVQAVNGSYDISLGNGKNFNTENKGFFIAPADVVQNIVHNADENGFIFCRWVFLKVKLNDVIDFCSNFHFPVIVPENYRNKLNSVFDCLFESENPFEQHVCYYEIIKILSDFSEEKPDKSPDYIISSLEYIKQNYNKKINVHLIAQTVNMSESHFHSVFKKAFGISPMAFLNKYRLSLAVEYLINTNKTITEIANLVGINDSVYFNKMFRKAYQLSPTEYRRIYKN